MFPAPVNNEGDTPVDLAEDDHENVVDMIRQQIDKLGVWECVVVVCVCVGGGEGGEERERYEYML